MNLSNLQWAYTEDEIRNISGANKEESYYLDSKRSIPLVYCQGEINKPYWRKEPNVDDALIRQYFGTSESVEHYNSKMYFNQCKQLEFKGNIIKADSSKVEYRVKNINKIVDVVYFDTNNRPMLGIEIYKTNKKTNKDIILYNQLNFPIYEYNYNTNTGEFISYGRNAIAQINSIEREIEGTNTIISKLKGRIKTNKTEIPILQKRIGLEIESYYREKEEIGLLEYEAELFKNEYSISEGIRRTSDKIRSLNGSTEIDIVNEQDYKF